MRRIHKNKTTFASLLLGMYVFLALFLVNLHHHGSGEVFKDFQFKKIEKSITESHSEEEFTDCILCHISQHSKNIVLADFSIAFQSFNIFKEEVFVYQQTFSTIQNHVLKLRGPPVFL